MPGVSATARFLQNAESVICMEGRACILVYVLDLDLVHTRSRSSTYVRYQVGAL
eukprot:COSAG02_NODE_374_length_23583_cov_12.568855_5_plen_54_part_00